MEYLLKGVYKEYTHFYRYKQRRPYNWNHYLKIKKTETKTTPKNVHDNDEYGVEEESNSSKMSQLTP